MRERKFDRSTTEFNEKRNFRPKVRLEKNSELLGWPFNIPSSSLWSESRLKKKVEIIVTLLHFKCPPKPTLLRRYGVKYVFLYFTRKLRLQIIAKMGHKCVKFQQKLEKCECVSAHHRFVRLPSKYSKKSIKKKKKTGKSVVKASIFENILRL